MRRGAPQHQRGTPVIRVGVRRAAAGGEPSQAGGQRGGWLAAPAAAPGAAPRQVAPPPAPPQPPSSAPLAMVGELQPILAQAGVPHLQILEFIAGFLRDDAASQAAAYELLHPAGGEGCAGAGAGVVRSLVAAYAAAFPCA